MTDVVKHDPRGLIQHDMIYLRQTFKPRRYKPTMSHGEIMYAEGQQAVLDFIERTLIAKRAE